VYHQVQVSPLSHHRFRLIRLSVDKNPQSNHQDVESSFDHGHYGENCQKSEKKELHGVKVSPRRIDQNRGQNQEKEAAPAEDRDQNDPKDAQNRVIGNRKRRTSRVSVETLNHAGLGHGRKNVLNLVSVRHHVQEDLHVIDEVQELVNRLKDPEDDQLQGVGDQIPAVGGKRRAIGANNLIAPVVHVLDGEIVLPIVKDQNHESRGHDRKNVRTRRNGQNRGIHRKSDQNHAKRKQQKK